VTLDVEEFGTALAGEAASARALLVSLGSDIADIVEARRDSNNDDEHDPEGATLAFERSQADALRRSAQDRLAAIDRAERRLVDGSYGTCVVCSGHIPVGRLEARPWADRCVSCV
jgi:DnaK suppressor protein